MTSLEYAHDGYRFFRVQTPDIFCEYELPEDNNTLTLRQAKQLSRLIHLSEIHNAPILNSAYRCG